MRTLYDSVTAGDIPRTAEMVAGYIDGRYAWSGADWDRFPNAVKVRIAVSPWTNDGHCLDVESGDAEPYQAPGWVAMRRRAGVDPSVYTSYSEWPAVRVAFTQAGVAEPHYWIALWDNRPGLLYNAVAKQYSDPPASGGHYDLSAVADYWPGVDSDGPNNAGGPITMKLAAPIVAGFGSKSGNGYYMVGADGGVFTFGDAQFHGSMGGKRLAAAVTGGALTPSGNGYWLFAADGGVFSFGDAGFFGSVPGLPG